MVVSTRQVQVRRRRRALAVGVVITAAAVPFVAAQLGGASSPAPTVDEVRAKGCNPRFSLLTDSMGPTRKTVTNIAGCAGVKVTITHDGPDGEPVVYGVFDLGDGTITVDASHAVCAKRTYRDGDRVVDGGDTVQWDAWTGDPTGWGPGDHAYRLWTAAWLKYPGCPAPTPTTQPPAPAPTTPPSPPISGPPVPVPSVPPGPAPTVPPAPPAPGPTPCPTNPVGPPPEGCGYTTPPTNPPAPPPTVWTPPPSTIVGTPPCPPVGPPGGIGNPSCPSQGGYVAP